MNFFSCCFLNCPLFVEPQWYAWDQTPHPCASHCSNGLQVGQLLPLDIIASAQRCMSLTCLTCLMGQSLVCGAGLMSQTVPWKLKTVPSLTHLPSIASQLDHVMCVYYYCCYGMCKLSWQLAHTSGGAHSQAATSPFMPVVSISSRASEDKSDICCICLG